MAKVSGMSVGPPSRRGRLPMEFQAILGVCALLGLLAATSLVAMLLVLNLKTDETNLNDRDMPFADAVAAATLNAKGIANDERGYLLTGDQKFLQEADGRIGGARAAFAAAARSAADAGQRQAVDQARTGFERWVQAIRGEFETFETGDRRGAIAAAVGPDRELRKAYEGSLARAQDLSANSIRSTRDSVAAALSRSVWAMLACLLVALAIGAVVSFWLVRSIALPVYRLAAFFSGDAPF